MPYIASLIGRLCVATGMFRFGNYPTTSSAERRLRRHRPEHWELRQAFRAAESAAAQSATGEPVWRHALSLFGDVKYPADFKRFDYVNPDAPRAASRGRF